jgi:hypothetical protein
MATTWALTAEQIVDQACWNLGLAGINKSVRPEHRMLGLRILNAILKRLKIYGYAWPKSVDAEWRFAIDAGNTQPIAGPSDFLSAPVIKVFEDIYRDGFGREADATSLGTPDQGNDYQYATGSVYGITGGQAYAVSGFTGPAWMDVGQSDGVFGTQLKAISVAQTPYLAFRLQDYQNYLRLKVHSSTQYTLEKVVAGVATILATYTVTPAANDWLEVNCIGQTITPLINGSAQTTVYTDAFEDDTGLGFGAIGTTPRFKNLFYGTGKERDTNVVMSGYWQGINDRLQTAPYPTDFYIDPAGYLHSWPVAEYPVRAKMEYQAKIDDLATNTAPDVDPSLALTLIHMVTDELSIPTGRRELGEASRQKWQETLPLDIAAASDHGDAILDYDE